LFGGLSRIGIGIEGILGQNAPYPRGLNPENRNFTNSYVIVGQKLMVFDKPLP
jgi:hypothetical protein